MSVQFKADFDPTAGTVLPVPYLESKTDEVKLERGRQLFVDDYLIEWNTFRRIWHPAEEYAYNPVLEPETEIELDHGEAPMAAPFNDGLWYDPQDRLYKLYYHAGWFHGTALAISRDGIHWERPDLGIVGHTNLVIPPRPGYERDGCLVWLDQHAEKKEERWKMFLFFRHPNGENGELRTSADGIHWNFREFTGDCGDNSSFFHDPFRKQWIFSVRCGFPSTERARAWLPRSEFIAPPWKQRQPDILNPDYPDPDMIPWARADELDPFEEETQFRPQLYDLNAVPYESLLLGLFAIFHGPENNNCELLACPKRIDLHPAFSRDGYHWSRPEERIPLLRCTRKKGDWNRGYLHAAGGICLTFRDKLRFYHAGFSAKSNLGPGEKGSSSRGAYAMYAGASTGFAELRRDGFASLHTDTEGILITRPMIPNGRFLRINAAAETLRIEVLDRESRPVPGYSIVETVPFRGDSTSAQIRWKTRDTLPETSPIRLRFTMENGDLYSFWFTDDPDGKSGGYLAAGSGDYASDRDL